VEGAAATVEGAEDAVDVVEVVGPEATTLHSAAIVVGKWTHIQDFSGLTFVATQHSAFEEALALI
jgi:hypothetical protein